MPSVQEILRNLSLPNEGPQGPPNTVMMHPGMNRPPMPGPPHMNPQMGGPPMGGPVMRPGMVPTMMPQQRMMGMPNQPPQHQGPGGPMGQPPMPVGAVLHQVRPQGPQQIQQPGPQPGPPGAFPVHGQRPMLIQQGK